MPSNKSDVIDVGANHPIGLTSDLDRDWFDDHPGRLLRLRFATDGDYGMRTEDGSVAVFVFCPMDGLRFRNIVNMPFALTARLMSLESDEGLLPYFKESLRLLKAQSVVYSKADPASMRPLSLYLEHALKETMRLGRKLTDEEHAKISKLHRQRSGDT